MAIYAVGDIQGCYDPLRRLLDKISFDPTNDTLWCVGDMVNRGPDSLAVLRYLKSLGSACVCVLGNHDLHLLGRIAGEKAYRRDTLNDVLNASDLDDIAYWLRHLPILHHDVTLNWTMVHAGLHPHWHLSDAMKRAHQIEKTLQSDHWQNFCTHIHHREFPHREPQNSNPLEWGMFDTTTVFDTAVFTRVRYCTQDGHFNWDIRFGDSLEEGEKGWFEHETLAWRDETRVVYGHWSSKGLVCDQPHVLGLDSGCVWGHSLTAAWMDTLPIKLISE